MSVAPDVLMTTTATVSTTNTVGTSVGSAESGIKDTESFSQVYAREQQTQLVQSGDLEGSSQSRQLQSYQHNQAVEPVEHREDTAYSSPDKHEVQDKSVEHSGAGRFNKHGKDTAHNTSSRPADRGNEASDPAIAEEKTTELADSGKTLPAEQDDSTNLENNSVDDSFLLLGLFESSTISVELDSVPAESGQLAGVATGQLKDVGTADMQWDEELSLNLEDAAQLTQQTSELSSHNTEQLAEQGSAVVTANEGQLAASTMSSMGISTSADDVATSEDADSSVLELDAVDTAEQGNSKGASQSQLSDLGELGQLLAQPMQTARSSPVSGQTLDMQSSNWNESLADQVMWMSSQNLKSAQIQLEPAELGRLDVHISMDQEQTLISFSSSNAAVRDALEGQSQRLRDMFSQQGMNLVDVNVSDQSQGRGTQGQGSGSRTGTASLADYSEDGIEEVQSLGSMELPSSLLGKGSGLVDFYA